MRSGRTKKAVPPPIREKFITVLGDKAPLIDMEVDCSTLSYLLFPHVPFAQQFVHAGDRSAACYRDFASSDHMSARNSY